MKSGETICYYRARGGERSVYVTILYDNDHLRSSIIQNYEPNHMKTVGSNKVESKKLESS